MAGILTSHSGLRPEAKRYVMAGRGVVVDAGGRGDFTVIQDAVDYMTARASGGRIWIREGEYIEAVTVEVANIIIEGASWDTIINGSDVQHALDLKSTATLAGITNIQIKTPAGGGNAYNAVVLRGDGNWMSHVHIPESDSEGIVFVADYCWIEGCDILDCDSDGVVFQGTFCRAENCRSAGSGGDGFAIDHVVGTSSMVVGCVMYDNTQYGVHIWTGAENCVVVGNRATNNSAGEIYDESGTSTVVGNDTD